jgi:hypothetical protein
MKTILSLETATQLAVFLENRPGTLARACEALAKAGINIHALTVSDTVDHSVVRMIVSDPTKALMLLGERGVLAFENDVLCIDAVNERGVLGKIAEWDFSKGDDHSPAVRCGKSAPGADRAVNRCRIKILRH